MDCAIELSSCCPPAAGCWPRATRRRPRCESCRFPAGSDMPSPVSRGTNAVSTHGIALGLRQARFDGVAGRERCQRSLGRDTRGQDLLLTAPSRHYAALVAACVGLEPQTACKVGEGSCRLVQWPSGCAGCRGQQGSMDTSAPLLSSCTAKTLMVNRTCGIEAW